MIKFSNNDASQISVTSLLLHNALKYHVCITAKYAKKTDDCIIMEYIVLDKTHLCRENQSSLS